VTAWTSLALHKHFFFRDTDKFMSDYASSRKKAYRGTGSTAPHTHTHTHTLAPHILNLDTGWTCVVDHFKRTAVFVPKPKCPEFGIRRGRLGLWGEQIKSFQKLIQNLRLSSPYYNLASCFL